MAADGVTPEETALERLTASGPESYADWCLDRIATALEVVASLEVLARQHQPAAEPGTPLPEDIPGREALAAVGVITLEALPRKGAELVRLGLDGSTASRVLTWLRLNE